MWVYSFIFYIWTVENVNVNAVVVYNNTQYIYILCRNQWNKLFTSELISSKGKYYTTSSKNQICNYAGTTHKLIHRSSDFNCRLCLTTISFRLSQNKFKPELRFNRGIASEGKKISSFLWDEYCTNVFVLYLEYCRTIYELYL